MKVNAEPTPLREPLAGGTEGATVVIEPLKTGETLWPHTFFDRAAPASSSASARSVSAPRRTPGSHGRFRPSSSATRAWATSWSTPACTHRWSEIPATSSAASPRRHYKIEEGEDIVSQLRDRGLAPSDIAFVVLTHLHEDHASGIEAFPDARLRVQRHRVGGRDDGLLPAVPRLQRAPTYDFAFEYHTVDFDADFIESYGPFGRSFDLFGDGSVRLAYTPGHSSGHTSVILRLPRRDFVIVGDAAYDWLQFEGKTEPTLIDDEHNWRRSLHELQAYRRTYPYALMVPGHDPEFWEKLEPRYEE